MSKGDWLW